MKKCFSILIGTVLVALLAPVVAELPSNELNTSREAAVHLSNPPTADTLGHYFVWIDPFAVALSGVNPSIFQNIAFSKDPGGMSSGDLFTTSMNNFINADPNAGASKAVKKVAKIGLVYSQGLVR
jgi:hypothetical protein